MVHRAKTTYSLAQEFGSRQGRLRHPLKVAFVSEYPADILLENVHLGQ